MLGEQLGESKGKRIVRRVLSSDPLTMEVTFEDSGTMLGIATSGFGTYTATVRADGSIYGEANGAFVSSEGDAVTWKATGLGKLMPGGAVSYRGMLYYRTTAEKFLRLNTVGGVFEYDADPAGNTTSKVWEWK
jgi:hypothetical protein